MRVGTGEEFLSSQCDERLVSLARAGHEPAFVAIVERYRPELHALARRLSSEGRGEDIVQQAFLTAFAALKSGTEVRHLRGWLYRIVRNAAARAVSPVFEPLDETTAGGLAVEDVAQQRALAMSALAELGRLPKRQRQALVGTALDGRPRAELASSMGLSEGAVRQLVHRARARLRTVVTAVTPWPLVQWLAGGGAGIGGAGIGGAGSGGAADAAAGLGAGAVSSGVVLKLGVVLVSGAIATGVAAVDSHGGARSHLATARAAAHVSHVARPRVTRRRAPAIAVSTVARVAPTPAGGGADAGCSGGADAGGGGPRSRVRAVARGRRFG